MADVRELRLVLTVQDFDGALSFYRDALGLDAEAVWASEGGHVTLLSAGRATLELVDQAHAAEIDRLEVVTTPWNDRNVRLEAPDGTQLTLFTPVE